MNKKLIEIIALTCLGAFVGGGFFYGLNKEVERQAEVVKEYNATYDELKPSVKEYMTFEYTITKVDGKDYYGKATNGSEGIYFTEEYIIEPIKEGDKVVAMFEPENTEDGLYRVDLKK